MMKRLLFVCLVFLSVTIMAENLPEKNFTSHVTYVQCEGIGRIAVSITEPSTMRYRTQTGAVILVSAYMHVNRSKTPFSSEPVLLNNGLVTLSFLWPGCTDKAKNVTSQGQFDYGGENCIQALSAVALFASGNLKDVNGKYLNDLVKTPVNNNNIGIYAFSHPGIAVVNLFSAHSKAASSIAYFVGGENPTTDTIIAVEIGHYEDNKGKKVQNPIYQYPQSYSLDQIHLDFQSLRYDLQSQSPYLDLDASGSPSAGDFTFPKRSPSMDRLFIYSYALTKALEDNRAFDLNRWPKLLATPEYAKAFWAQRSTSNKFEKINNTTTKVMLVFAKDDHVQTATDKPHIHQLYQGFKECARYDWVRLNPDEEYLKLMLPNQIHSYQDHGANTQPLNWLDIEAWALPPSVKAFHGSMAGILEMSDRQQYDRWEADLTQILDTH